MSLRIIASICLAVSIPATSFATTENFSVVFGGRSVGHVVADTRGTETRVDFNVKNNGRGPTMAETLRVDAGGLPVDWKLSGATTFGSRVQERFVRKGARAEWNDSTGKGSASPPATAVYVAQSGSPWSAGVYARALLRAPGNSLPALPGGTLHLDKGEDLVVQGADGPLTVTHYDLSGIDLTPTMLLLDSAGGLFAVVHPSSVVVRQGYEGEEARLRKLASDWVTARLVAIEHDIAHHYAAPVRIRNVRVYDPEQQRLSEPVSVVVYGREISAVEPPDSAATPGEVTIDGGGGTLIAGLHEMHAHLSQEGALLNLLAGVTTVRDMGNDNAVLDRLVARIEHGEIGGPRVIRSGFVEGRSPFSANNGFVVDSEAQALDAVRWYGARGYWQIKIYNSMNPAWVPAVVKEAHALGMRVAGHIPAFATADQMIEAGYDELTHINQFVLGWVIGPGEDTRTLFRLTALKRLKDLDLKAPNVQHTIDLMVEKSLAIDPTLAIHEALTHNRDGQVPDGDVDYFDHMPIGWRRDAMQAMADTSAPGDDEAYRAAFQKLLAVVSQLHDRGVFIVFGTDLGGSFTLHRELELYQQAGMTVPEILRRATLDAARYLGQDQRLGSIAKGKLADFFLVPGDPLKDLKAIKTIQLVAKDGVFYFPGEAYPRLGIQPFIAPPPLQLPVAP